MGRSITGGRYTIVFFARVDMFFFDTPDRMRPTECGIELLKTELVVVLKQMDAVQQ
jgi:hypothetical protein